MTRMDSSTLEFGRKVRMLGARPDDRAEARNLGPGTRHCVAP